MNTIRGEMLIQVVHGRIVGGVVMASAAMTDRHDVTEMWSRRTAGYRQVELQQPLGQPHRQRSQVSFDSVYADRRNDLQ